jgi:hypothetical protein
MEITLAKTITKNFKLQPYGKFAFKTTSKGKNAYSPNVIVFYEVDVYHETAMPMSKADEMAVVKMMKDNRTDVLTDGRYFYTRLNDGLVEINHTKLEKYRCDAGFKAAVDNGHSFGKKV